MGLLGVIGTPFSYLMATKSRQKTQGVLVTFSISREGAGLGAVIWIQLECVISWKPVTPTRWYNRANPQDVLEESIKKAPLANERCLVACLCLVERQAGIRDVGTAECRTRNSE